MLSTVVAHTMRVYLRTVLHNSIHEQESYVVKHNLVLIGSGFEDTLIDRKYGKWIKRIEKPWLRDDIEG